jgi:hypothetical protein
MNMRCGGFNGYAYLPPDHQRTAMAQGNTPTGSTRNRVTRQVFRFLESFLEQFVDMDTGVMGPAPFLRFLPVLNCLFRTPLHTSKTELALVVPDRFFVSEGNVLCRAYADAGSASGAGFISMKIPGSLFGF